MVSRFPLGSRSVTVEWHTTSGDAGTAAARDFSVHVGLVDRESPAPTNDSIDPLHFLISDAIDVVRKTWYLRGGPGIGTAAYQSRLDELTEQTLRAVCTKNLERPFVLKKVKAPEHGTADAWIEIDNNGSTSMKQSASVWAEPFEVAILARPEWYRGQTANLKELTDHLDDTASYLEHQSKGTLPDLSKRSIQSAKATASVLKSVQSVEDS